MIKPILEFLVRELVDDPEKVVVCELGAVDKTTYEIIVADDDIGKVVGKQGRIARAIRVLVKGLAGGDPHDINVVVLGDRRRRRHVAQGVRT